MKLLLLLGLLTLAITLTDAVPLIKYTSENDESLDENDNFTPFGHGQHEHDYKCQGLEDVDLSDLNLEMTELRKLVGNNTKEEKVTGNKFPFVDGNISLDDIQSNLVENAMEVVREVVVLPGKKLFAKIMKTSETSGDFTTAISGSANTSIDASTSGTAKFGVDSQIFTTSGSPHTSINGQTTVVANASTAWVKKFKVNVLQTKSSSSSSTNLSWTDATSLLQTPESISMTVNSSATGTASTVMLSKKCFGTKVGISFNTTSNVAGTGWVTSIVGRGKGGIFTRVLYATQNGSAVTWTFTKLTIKTHITVQGGNSTIDGSQYVTIKSFTESITSPVASPPTENGDRQLEVSEESKIRVGTKTVLSTGIKMYATGGQVVFKTSKMTIPALSDVEEDTEDEILDDDDEVPNIMVANVMRQAQVDNLLINPIFLHSNVASGVN